MSRVCAILAFCLAAAPVLIGQDQESKTVVVIADAASDRALAEKALDKAGLTDLKAVYNDRLEGESAGDQLLRAVSEPSANMVLVVGVGPTLAVLRSGIEFKIPVIACAADDGALFGMEHNDMGRSGVKNVNFVTLGSRTSRDLALFQELAHFDKVTMLVDESLSDDPKLRRSLAEIAENLEMEISLQGLDPNMFSGLNISTGAVYLGPLRGLDESGRADFFEMLKSKHLVSFSMLGLDDVNKGAFAGALTDGEKRLVNRVADHLTSVAAGEPAENLPTWLPAREQLTINGLTAGELGVEADLDLRLLADIIHPEALSSGRKISLKNAIETALLDNSQLAMQHEEAALATHDRKVANSQLLPQINGAASYERIDGDNPQVAAGFSPEVREQAFVEAEQVLFNDQLFTGSRTAKKNEIGARAQLRAVELDLVNVVAHSWLGVLSAEALMDIEIENLKRTRANLRTARARLQLGAGGNEEVFRWESQEAQQLGSVYSARADVETAKANLARLIGLEPGAAWILDPEPPSEKDTAFLDPSWNRMLSRSDRLLEKVLLKEARTRSPDLEAATVQTEITELRVGSAKRSFYVPSVTAKATYQDLLDQKFHSGASPLFPVNESGTWNFTVSAGIPIFNGGRRSHELGKAKAQHRQAEYRKTSVDEGLNERLSVALASARASLPNIQFTLRAADRAARNLEIVLSKYEQGMASILDLLEAQDQNLTQQRGAALAVYAHLGDLFDLQRALSYFDLLLPETDRASWLRDLEARLEQVGPQKGAAK